MIPYNILILDKVLNSDQTLTFTTSKEPQVFGNAKISINDYEFMALRAEI
jgi:hypothetical protein